MKANLGSWRTETPKKIVWYTNIQCGAPKIAKLVNITPISLWFMILITIVNGVYKPTNITGGAHIVTMEHHHFYYGKYKITIWALW